MLANGDLLHSQKADVAVARVIKKNGASLDLSSGGALLQGPVGGYTLLVVSIENTKKYHEVVEANDAYVFGYPVSIGLETPQIDYDKPLLRRGMIAGKNDSKRTIILDGAVFPGNSGGPVLEVEEVPPSTKHFKVIGVVSEFIPYAQKWTNSQTGLTNISLENSGYSVVVTIEEAFELIDTMSK